MARLRSPASLGRQFRGNLTGDTFGLTLGILFARRAPYCALLQDIALPAGTHGLILPGLESRQQIVR